MKILYDPPVDLAHLASTTYQRYVLYRLGTSATTKPWKPILGWLLIMPLGFMTSANPFFMWMCQLTMLFIFGATLGEIYFSRAVLAFIRTSNATKQEETEQAGDGDAEEAL